MPAIRVEDVSLAYGNKVILSGVNVEFHAGQVCGLVGPNGAGKSTLVRIITGSVKPDTGQVIWEKGVQWGLLTQNPELNPDHTVAEEARLGLGPIAELEAKLHAISDQMADPANAGRIDDLMAQYDKASAAFDAAGGYDAEARLNEVLGGLGFKPDDYKLPVRVLSGGQRCRVALAKLLLSDHNFLLLDEPTNHLDIDAVRWLEKFLAQHQGGAIVISHDRYLLDAVSERIVEVDRSKVYSWTGNYSAFVRAKEERDLTLQRQFEKDKEYIEKQKEFIRRFQAGQRAQEAQGRKTILERRLKAGEFQTDGVVQQAKINLNFKPSASAGTGTVVWADGLAKSFDGRQLFKNLALRVQAGTRLGITGPNGTGKSTLLKILLGLEQQDDGEVRIDPALDIGYYSQNADDLDPQLTPVDELRKIRPKMTDQEARDLLGRFRFSGDHVFTPIKQLSGGESSRVRLIKLILRSPALLVLDEPTNHLDIGSCEALEEALQEFPGTLLTVSHDRYFLDRLADELLVVRRDTVRLVKGNYSTYVSQLDKEAADARARADAEAAAKKKQAKQAEKSKPSKSSKNASFARDKKGADPYGRMSTQELEALVVEHEQRVADLEMQLADPSVWQDPDTGDDLRSELEVAQADLAAVEEAYYSRA